MDEEEEGVIMGQKIGSQGQTHTGKKKYINSSKASPKLRVSWGSPYLSSLGNFSFKLEILKLGDEWIKTVWFKKQNKNLLRQYRGM